MSRPPKTHNTKARLQGWISRIQQMDEEIKGLNADKADVFKEVKAAGIDPGAVRNAIRFLRDPDAAMERNAGTVAVLEQLGYDAGKLGEIAASRPQIENGGGGLEEPEGRSHTRVHVREAAGDGDE